STNLLMALVSRFLIFLIFLSSACASVSSMLESTLATAAGSTTTMAASSARDGYCASSPQVLANWGVCSPEKNILTWAVGGVGGRRSFVGVGVVVVAALEVAAAALLVEQLLGRRQERRRRLARFSSMAVIRRCLGLGGRRLHGRPELPRQHQRRRR